MITDYPENGPLVLCTTFITKSLKLLMRCCLYLCPKILNHAQHNKYRAQFLPLQQTSISIYHNNEFTSRLTRGYCVSVSQRLTNVTENQVKPLQVHCILKNQVKTLQVHCACFKRPLSSDLFVLNLAEIESCF